MLANLLAVVVGLGSLGFYLAAFILPEVHRRSDFFWSGVGMFYAVVLWYCARQMNGAVLLGQTASVGLLLWFGYQTLLMRRETTPPNQQTPIRFGKTDNNRLHGGASRPIAKDYEFVEDGVEDIIAQEPAPDSPILLKPTADDFAPTMVVPAAMPKPSIEEAPPEESQPTIETSADKATQKREKPNPIAAVGIFAGWLTEIVTPKKKAPKPMIELPSRPPSIPKSDQPSNNNNPSTIKPTRAEQFEPDLTSSNDESSLPLTPQQQDNDEDSNWPDEDFWD